MMASDWNQVTVIRKSQRKNLKSITAINAARRQGAPIISLPKPGAGRNKQHVPVKSATIIDRATLNLKHKQVSNALAKLIQGGRQAKGLSQKDLAAKICEKTQVIRDYESARGILNTAILSKIEKVIGIKLRGKDLGQPLAIKK